MIAIPATGAAVASTTNANFSLDTLSLSITGLMIGPTISECILMDIPKIFVWIGDISFTLFLIHYYPVMFFSRIGEGIQNGFLRVLLALAGFVLAFAVSVPVHFLFDKKISGKIAVFLKKI